MAKKKADVNKLTIKTSVLQEMVAKAVKGAKNDKVLPLTQMMAIQLKDNVLTLITTSVTNTLYIRANKVDGNDFYVVVPVEKFSKLIARLTSDTVSMEIDDKSKSLAVKGNGNYNVEIQYDEDDTMVVFPDPLEEVELDEDALSINNTTVNVILNTLRPALAQTLENPCYTGYYVGEKVVATDRFLINALNVELFEEPRLIRPEVMDLLDCMTAEKIQVDFSDDIVIFSSPDCVVFSRDLEGIEDFSIDAISNYIDLPFESVCKIPKAQLLQLLDRLSLFVTEYDKGGIYLTFTKDGLQVTSKASSAVELIPYVESSDFKSYTCCMDINMLMKQVKAYTGDSIEIWYGSDSAIKFVRDNIVQIIALLDDDRFEEEDDVDTDYDEEADDE